MVADLGYMKNILKYFFAQKDMQKQRKKKRKIKIDIETGKERVIEKGKQKK